MKKRLAIIALYILIFPLIVKVSKTVQQNDIAFKSTAYMLSCAVVEALNHELIIKRQFINSFYVQNKKPKALINLCCDLFNQNYDQR